MMTSIRLHTIPVFTSRGRHSPGPVSFIGPSLTQRVALSLSLGTAPLIKAITSPNPPPNPGFPGDNSDEQVMH